jgi:hypothetical protein
MSCGCKKRNQPVVQPTPPQIVSVPTPVVTQPAAATGTQPNS